MLVATQAWAEPQKRCGWWDNPSPSNVWFFDADGEWTVSTQGGPQATGPWPKFKDSQFVPTNGLSYGHGCACLTVEADKEAKHITKIKAAKALPLQKCRADAKLKEPMVANDD